MKTMVININKNKKIHVNLDNKKVLIMSYPIFKEGNLLCTYNVYMQIEKSSIIYVLEDSTREIKKYNPNDYDNMILINIINDIVDIENRKEGRFN